MIVAISMILIGALILAGIFGAIYLGLTDQQQREVRELALMVSTFLVAVGAVALVGYGIDRLVDL